MKQMTKLFTAATIQPCQSFFPTNTVETIVSRQER